MATRTLVIPRVVPTLDGAYVQVAPLWDEAAKVAQTWGLHVRRIPVELVEPEHDPVNTVLMDVAFSMAKYNLSLRGISL